MPPPDVTDLRSTIVPKSDQLNSEQLLGGPITVTVSTVKIGTTDEQPISIHYENDLGRPFKPCKTMRKVLIFAWGEDGRVWSGRSMTLYCDPTVKFGGEQVGGIRISHLSDIERDIQVSLTATKGKKALHTIKRLAMTQGASTVDHAGAIAGATTVEDLKQAFGRAYSSTKDQAKRADFKRQYDKRTAELTAAPAGPSYAELVDDINAATDAEIGGLLLDQSRDLPADLQAELLDVYRRRFPEASQ